MQSEDSLAAANVVAVIAHLYGCKAIDAATVYSLLEHLQSRWATAAVVPASQANSDTSPSSACLLKAPCVDHGAAEVMRADLSAVLMQSINV